MLFRHCKHSLPLLLLFILLTSHSAYPIPVRQQLQDARSILTSPGLLETRSFFNIVRKSFLPSSSSFITRWSEGGGNSQRYITKSRKVKAFTSDRQSEGDRKFVIFASSPGKSGLALTKVAAQNDDAKNQPAESNDDIPAPSNDAEPVTTAGSRSIPSSSDLVAGPGTDNATLDAEAKGREVSPVASPSAIPKADAFLNVSTDVGSSQNNVSIVNGPQLVKEPTFEVELSVTYPSAEELLDLNTQDASPEDHGDSSIASETSNDVIPQPSGIPELQDENGAVILVPPDTETALITPESTDIDTDLPEISANPIITESVEPSELEKATPQVANNQPDLAVDKTSAEQQRGSPVSTIEEPPAEQEKDSAEPNILVDVPLSFSSSNDSLAPQFDRHSRDFLATTTNTTSDQWKPTEVSGTVRTIQRQGGSRWEITYQGEMSESSAERSVEKLERNINEGDMGSYLTDRLSTPVTVRTASPPSLNALPKKEVPVSGSALKETASGEDTTDPEESSDESLGVVLGTCFGLLGALVLGAAAFVVARRRSGREETHVLDGVATAPTTIMSFESDRSVSESRFHTGAPTKPRGPNVLRNQSRILDWQMDHVTATGKARHILGREGLATDGPSTDSTSDEGDVSTAEIVV